MNLPTDVVLVRQAREGDETAFRSLVQRNRRFVINLAFRFLASRADAEDAAQEVFIKLWRKLDAYREEVKVTTWLYTMVTNHCVDVLKSAGRRRSLRTVTADEHLPVTDPASLVERADLQERLRLVAELANQLPEKQHAVFVLRDLQGLEPAEVSGILEMPAEAVKSNLYHARLKMRALILDYEKEKIKL